MEVYPHFVFPPFRFDLATEQLWQGERPIPLRRQTFAVLRYLIEHAGQVVTKQALLEALWPSIYVTDVAPMICINELRKALGDDARRPQFIETVHRRGYRFIAPITAQPVQSSRFPVQSPEEKQKAKSKGQKAKVPTTQHSVLTTQHSVLVGRETELAQLLRWLEKALHGERQIIFVTGEPGIGKTAVVEAFLKSLESEPVQRPTSKLQRRKGVQGSTFKVPGTEPTPNPQPLTPSTQHLAPSTQAEARAEACFHKAIEIARRQQAKSLELRVTVSLTRLWQQQGKKKEAHQKLSEIYNWFTEGFDTKDLQEAKALLGELA